MQHLEEPARADPNIQKTTRRMLPLPWKTLFILVVCLAFIGGLLALIILDNSDLHIQLSEVKAELESKEGREESLAAFQQVNNTLKTITSSYNELLNKPDTYTTLILPALRYVNSSLTDTRAQLVALNNLYSALNEKVLNLSVKNVNASSGEVAREPPSNNSSVYLCDTSGVPSFLLFQYKFNCTCTLRGTYGPYLDLGAACRVNNDYNACKCYYEICDSQIGLC